MIKRLVAIPVLIVTIIIVGIYLCSGLWILLWIITGNSYIPSVFNFCVEIIIPFFDKRFDN